MIEAVKSSHLISKRLRSVRVIGEAVPCFKTKGSGSAPTQEPRINCFEAQEPFIFEFDDGSTLEFWPQGPDYLRMACSTISSAIKNGMSFNTPIFQEFFAGVFGESWQGYEFKDFEIVRIKHKAKVTSSIKEKIKEDIGDEIYYRFRFGNDCCFEFRPNPTGDKYDIFFSHGDSNSVPSSQLNSLSDGSDLLTHICWSTALFAILLIFIRMSPSQRRRKNFLRPLRNTLIARQIFLSRKTTYRFASMTHGQSISNHLRTMRITAFVFTDKVYLLPSK